MLRKERNDLYKNTFSCDQTGFLQEAGFLKQIVIKHYIFFFQKNAKDSFNSSSFQTATNTKFLKKLFWT